MKKKLLLGAFLLGSFFTVKAQVLQSDDFNALTAGDVGTDLTGNTAGQGDWYTLSVTGATNSDFSIVNENEAMGNVIQITGAATASGTTQETDNTRYAFRAGLDEAWEGRTAGNDIVTVEFDFYPTSTVGSTTLQRLALYGTPDGTAFRVMGGIQFNAANNQLGGIIYYSQNGQAGTYTINFAEGGLVITPNQWYHITYLFNTATGDAAWLSEDVVVGEGTLAGTFTSTFAAGLDLVELDLVTIAGQANTAANSAKYDNIVVSAEAAELGTDDFLASQFSIYPNPASDVINIANAENILVNGVEIVDLNGRVVKSVKFNGVTEAQINISDLSSGMYLMNVSSDKGTTTKKIVKN